jgi:hypothetical protein
MPAAWVGFIGFAELAAAWRPPIPKELQPNAEQTKRLRAGDPIAQTARVKATRAAAAVPCFSAFEVEHLQQKRQA